MNQKPNVTVIYQEAPQAPIGCVALILEIVAFLGFVIVVGLMMT